MTQEINKNEVSAINKGIAKSPLGELIATKEIKDTIIETLGKNRVQTFIGSALTVSQDPKLKDVEPNSLFYCLLKSATYNLPVDPNLGYAFPVPYKNEKNIKIAQFQMGTKGIIELAYRTGQYQRLNVKDVRQGEIIGYDFFGEAEIKWIIKDREKLPIIGYVAAFELTNGMRKRVYWDTYKIDQHSKKYSKAHQNALKYGKTGDDLWSNSFGAMAEKTVLKDLLKYAPKSVELQDALQFDQSVIQRKNGIVTPIYIDNKNEYNTTNESTIYDIDDTETNNETIVEDVVASEQVVEENTPPINNDMDEENDPNISIIFYGTYLEEKDKWLKEDYPDGRKAYQNIDGKKTIRVRLKEV